MSRTLSASFLLIFAVLLPVACAGAESPAPAAGPGRIAFTVNDDGFGEIWLMDPDGQNRTRLTAAAEGPTDAPGSVNPAWSPDGRLIAFASTGDARAEDQRDFEIYLMQADGNGVTRLTDDRMLDLHPTWSPDGTKIAFAHWPDVGTGDADGVLVIMDANGEERSQITRHPQGPELRFDFDPAWSPDGKLIAFVRITYANERAEPRVAIHTTDPDSGEERVLIEDAGEPAWSPDGERILFTSYRDRNGETCFHDCSPSGEIYVADADGTAVRRLTTDEADDRSPAWSPDGRQIMFVSDRSNRTDHENEIYVMAVDGSDVRRITTNDVWDLDPAWRG
jgi:Tol biopolymer transport system component